jgi:hypothetical protein
MIKHMKMTGLTNPQILTFATRYDEDLSGCTCQWNGTAYDARNFTAFGAHDERYEE